VGVYRRGVVWYCDYIEKGVRVKRATSAISKREALLEEAKIREFMHSAPAPTDMVLSDAIHRCYKERWAVKKAGMTMLSRTLAIVGILGNLQLHKIDEVQVNKLSNSLRDQGLSPATLNRYRAYLRTVLNVAWKEWKVINRVPVIKNTPESLKRFKVYSTEEEEKLLLASNLSFMRDLVILLVDTGMRLGEALAITNKDIDFDRNIIVLGSEITKSEKSRSVPMTKRVREMLSPMAGISGRVPVFNVNKDAVERAWLKVKREAGYEDSDGMVLHALRHTYASRLVQAGVELYTVKELLGHSTFKMTERYAHLNPVKLQAAVAVLERHKGERHES